MRKSGGEIVEVEGGHIVRSTGRKDRHSKVCTAKGPRDRRVRLAAHTAIQFYDVQDRLGYDRPSKAVDWLINKAKAAIDELAHLPPWHPTSSLEPHDADHRRRRHHHQFGIDLVIANTNDQQRTSPSADTQGSSFLPPSLDSDAIADTIKSFFPPAEASSAAMQFHSFTAPDLPSRNDGGGGGSSSSQDLRLSLQSFQDPILLHHHHENPTHQTLSGTPLGLDGWAEHHQFQRLATLNGGDGGGAAGYFFNVPPAPQPLLQQLLGQNQFVSQRGPLQSSNTPSIRAWIDPSDIAISTADDHHHHHQSINPFTSGVGGFSGFHIPARIQGDNDEEHDGYSDKPSSASSDSRH